VYGSAATQTFNTSGYQQQPGYPQPGFEEPTAGIPSPAERGLTTGEPGPASQRGSRRLLLILALIGVVVVLAAVTTAITLAVRGSGASFAIGDCVKQSGTKAVGAACSDSKSYRVTNKVGKQSDCADANQPFVVISKNGKDQVLCLRPATER
jgi:hypothetical protein